MVSFELSDEQQELQALARRYAEDVIRPVAWEREKIRDWRERTPLELIGEGARRGIRTLSLPREWGGRGIDMLTICLLGEELAAADCGIAIIFDHCWRFGRLISTSGSERQQQKYIPMFRDDPDFWVGTTATEANRGGTANVLRTADEPMETTARRVGDEYILNGRKVFISNGAMARLFTVQAVTDPSVAYPDGVSTFIVTRDMPGLGYGKVYAKIGSRNLINAEVVFEDCRVPAENLMGVEGRGTRLQEDFLGSTHPEIGAIILGIARAAYEETLRYARQRVAGGKPIVEHQAVALVVAEMYARIEAARQLIWRAAWEVDRNSPEGARLGWVAKTFAADVALWVTQQAVVTFGGNGIMEDYPVEKLARDALAFHHMHGTNDALRIKTAAALAATAELGGDGAVRPPLAAV